MIEWISLSQSLFCCTNPKIKDNYLIGVNYCQLAIFSWGLPSLNGIKYLDPLFHLDISHFKPKICLSEIGGLSCITLSMVLPGFLMNTL